jgi:hypothetical protein
MALAPNADNELRSLLRTLSPSAREHLRSVLIRDQADRDAIASSLLRYRDERGTAWANLVDSSRSILSSGAAMSGSWESWKPLPSDASPIREDYRRERWGRERWAK